MFLHKIKGYLTEKNILINFYYVAIYVFIVETFYLLKKNYDKNEIN